MQFTEVVDAGPGWTTVRDESGNVYTLTGDRNWRNNNPGNLEYGPFAQSMGAIGSDGRFAVFPTYEMGREAKSSLIFDSPSYRDRTLSQAINRYAPPSENNTTSYINALVDATGVSPGTVMSQIPADIRPALLDAMQRVEGFNPGRIVDASGNTVDPSILTQPQTAVAAINQSYRPDMGPGGQQPEQAFFDPIQQQIADMLGVAMPRDQKLFYAQGGPTRPAVSPGIPMQRREQALMRSMARQPTLMAPAQQPQNLMTASQQTNPMTASNGASNYPSTPTYSGAQEVVDAFNSNSATAKQMARNTLMRSAETGQQIPGLPVMKAVTYLDQNNNPTRGFYAVR